MKKALMLLLAVNSSCPCSCALAQAPTDDEVFSKYEGATICIKVEGELYNGQRENAGVGSAFFVNDDRFAITNRHVLPDFNLYKSVNILGTIRESDDAPDVSIRLQLVAQDDTYDLALLMADAPVPSRYVYSGNSRRMRVGLGIITIGCPLGMGPTFTGGKIGNVRDDPQGRWITDTPLNPGNSGGPVFYAGNVVGIAAGGIRALPSAAPIMGLNLITPFHVAVEGLLKQRDVKLFSYPSLAQVLTARSGLDSNGVMYDWGTKSTTTRNWISRITSRGDFDRYVIGLATTSSVPKREFVVPKMAEQIFWAPAIGWNEQSTATSVDSSWAAPEFLPKSSGTAELLKINPVPKGPRVVSKAFEIRQIKDDHAQLQSTSKSYLMRFTAERGYVIDTTSFGELSRANSSAPRITVSQDKTRVDVEFELSSGPINEPYRGWLTGTLVTRQVKQ